MRGVNRVTILGNLGRDPELRYTQGGTAVANFSVATSEQWNDKQTGEKKEQTEWHRISCFGRLAEIAGEYLHKGSKVYIEGSLRTRQYEKDGQTHYSTEINARELQMLDSRGDGGDRTERAERQAPAQRSASSEAPARRTRPQREVAPAASEPDFDDDIPF